MTSFDVYLKAGDNSWYWFSYFRGVLMSYSSNLATYNDIISNTKEKQRRDPNANSRIDFEYIIGVPDRVQRFIRGWKAAELASMNIKVMRSIIVGDFLRIED
ncbi:MAG: hypothetical protein R2758_16515 [Bacteroidales bacterium]